MKADEKMDFWYDFGQNSSFLDTQLGLAVQVNSSNMYDRAWECYVILYTHVVLTV